MSNMTNTEAFDGMREAEQISRPIVELLKSLQRQMEAQNQQLENYLSQLKEEKRPRQLEAQLREAEKACSNELDKEIKQCAANGYPEMAEKLEVRKEIMQQNIESKIEHIKGNAWVGQPYDQELRDASRELSTMLSMQKELAKDNKSMDYSRTMEKMDAIAQNSPILEKTGIAVKDCYRDFVSMDKPEKVMTKKLEKAAPAKEKSEFAKRLEEAVKEARKLSAAKAMAPAKGLGSRAADAMERVL